MSEDSRDILELGSVIRRGYGSIIANAGKVIAVITLLVAVIVTFTDVAFSDLTSREFTTMLAVMLLSSYLMYFSLEDTGEKEGEGCEEYKIASEKYLLARSRITPYSIDALRDFCLNYAKKELEYRRLSYLSEMGYSKGDFDAYKSGKSFPRRAVRIFRRAENMRAVKLTPQILLSRAHGMTKSELVAPTYKKVIGAFMSLIPSTVCMIFTISVILTTKDNMSISTVVDGLVKLSALPIIGFKGLIDGYRYAKEDKSCWLEIKARLLESFLGEEGSDA